MWATAGPAFCKQVESDIGDKDIRYGIIDGFCATWRFKLENLVSSDNTVATDQIIRYPPVADNSRYTFSLSAFPQASYASALADYFTFSKQYYAQKGYRINMLNVGYSIAKDQGSLLSYSWDGPVMTIDPVSTGGPEWDQYLLAYNDFCSAHGGIPLFNQTDAITPAQVQKALGGRLQKFADARKTVRSIGTIVERILSRDVGRVERERRRRDAGDTLGTTEKELRHYRNRVGLRRRDFGGAIGGGESEPEAIGVHSRARDGVAGGHAIRSRHWRAWLRCGAISILSGCTSC